jgi:hypothetical protein
MLWMVKLFSNSECLSVTSLLLWVIWNSSFIFNCYWSSLTLVAVPFWKLEVEKEDQIASQTWGQSLEETRNVWKSGACNCCCQRRKGNMEEPSCSISRGWHSITMVRGWEAMGGTKSDISSLFTPPTLPKLQFLMWIHSNVSHASHWALTSSHVAPMIAIMQYDFVCKSAAFRNHVK